MEKIRERDGNNRRGRGRKSEGERRKLAQKNGEEGCLIWIIPISICDDNAVLIPLSIIANNVKNDIILLKILKNLLKYAVFATQRL